MRYPAYPKYKSTGTKWLDEVPENWIFYSLKRIVKTPITDGPHTTPEFLDNGIPFVSAESVWDGRVHLEAKRGFISEEAHHEYGRKYLPQQHDIYIVKSGSTTGKIAIVDFEDEFNIWSPLAALRCDRNVAFPKFVFYALGSEYFQRVIQVSWSFGTQPNIGMDVLNNLQLLLPSPPEQRAIADFLDRETAKLDTLVAKKRALIEKLKEKRTALISRTVTRGLPPEVAHAAGLDPQPKLKPSGIEWLGEVPAHWEVNKIRHLALLKSGENITSEELEDDGEFPVFGGNGIRGYSSRFSHEGHYVLIGRQGALCGNINYAKGKFWASEHAVVVSPLAELATVWLGELLRSMNLNQYSISAAQPGLSVEMITKLKIPVPPLPEQRAIADYLDRETAKIDQMAVKVEEAIARLQEYRTALITAAVTGKIEVRGVKHGSQIQGAEG